MSDSLLYKRWEGIKTRCTNQNDPSYARYGGRGIFMHDEWLNSPSAFMQWATSNGGQKRSIA